MDNTPDWDALSDTPPIAPVAQDRSTPMDSQVADFADEANRRVAAGEDAATVEQDLQRKVTAAEPKTKAKASTDWDSLFDAPPRASELTSAYQPLEGYQGQVYSSPSAALSQPDAYAAGSQVQGVGDYLENLGTEAAEKLRTAGAGIVQAVGEIPQMGRDIAAKFDTLTGGVQGGVPPSAVFTAAAQAQGAPADNTLAQAGAFEAQKGLKAQEQAAARLVPAPDENTSGLDQTAYYAQQALAGAPTLAGAMAAGPVGGAALFGATTAGEQYAGKRAAGEAPVSAAASSGIEGAVSALTASLSLESALNPGAIGALKRIAETTGSVEAQSVINEATSIAAEQTIDGKDISADEIKQRLIDAAKGGLPAGVLMGGIGAVAAHDPAAAAAANVERLAANLAPEAVRPTLEERVNAREIPQDQGVLPEQGTVQAGSGETGREGVQRGAQAGPEAGNAREQVNTRGSLPQVGDTIEWQSGMFNQRMQGIVSRLQKDPVTGDLVPIAKVGTRETPVAEWGDSGRIVKSQEAPNVDQNVQPAGAERAGAQEAEGTQGAEAPEVEQGVPFMVTQAMKRDLRTAGYSDDDIRQMTPQQAHDALGAANELAAPTDVEAGRAVGADRTEAAIASGEKGVRPESESALVAEPLYSRAETAGVDDAREVQDAAKAWREQGTDSPYFQRFFGDSKVVDAEGKPLPVHHGTGEDFTAFAPESAGESTGHMTAPLGHFFAVDRGSAERYAEKAANGVPADQRVIDAYLSIKNPKTMTLDEFMAIDSQDEARALKAKLQDQGYDGIHLTDAGKGQWIAFDPSQIKDVGNRGTFDPKNPNILLAQREGAPVSDNLTKAEARDVLTKEFGAAAMRKLEANGLNLVPKTAIAGHALTEQQRAGVKGFTPADRSSANIVHDNVTRAELPETAIHEVVHANLDRILPEATRNALASAIQARAQRSPEVRAALDAIPKTTPRSALKEEILAQSMGSLYTQPIGRRVMDAFKLGLNRLGVPLDWLSAHEAAIRQIGIENLRHYAESPRRAPVTTVQLAKPRVRVPVDQVPVNRTGVEDEQQGRETGGRGVPASDAGANAGAVREAGGQALPTEAGTRNAAAAGVREPPVRTTGAGGVVREPTSIKNETVTGEREARNLGPIETQLGNDFGENNDQAKARLEANPLHGEELTKELIANPRPHTDVESAVLLRDRVRLQNEHADAMKRAETAMDSGDEAEHLRARMTARQIEDKLEANEQAAKHAGSATARGLNARRMMMNEDYSLARIITRARVLNGGDISPEQHAVFEDLAKRIAKTDEAAPKITTRRAVSNDPRAVASEFDQLKAELARISAKPTSQAHYARAEPDVARIIRRMAENRVRAGMTGDDVVNAVHAAVKDYADVSPRDVRDAISGYGTERKPTKDEISIRLTELRKQLREASRREDVANGKRDPVAVSRERAVQTRLAGDVKKLKSQLQTKDYERPQRQAPVYDAKTHAMQAERAELARRVNAELEKIRQSSRSPVEKTVDFGLNLRRAVILSSIKTLGKLTSAAGERLGFDPLEELAGGFAGRLPGVRGIAARAPIEGGVSGHAIAEGFRHALNKESREAAMQKLKTGVDNLDLMFGGKRDYEHTNSWLDYVAQLHGMLKTPAKYARFYSSIAKYAKFERARVIGEGMTPAQADAHMQDPVTIAMMGGKAYENANRSIFMQDNAAVTAYKVMLGYLSKAGAEGSMTRAFSKTAEKTGRYLLPIVRIPTNFVAESGSYGLGAAKALGQVIAAKGVEKLTPDQADYVMRNLKKQTIGAALMYMGYVGADSIGGYYQQGDNKRRLKNAPGDMTIGGVTIPRFLTHNPAMEMLQIGATIRRVQEARAAKDEHPVASGVLAAGKGLLSEVPFFDTPSRIGEAATNVKTVGKYLGGEVRSAFIPPDVQNVARMMDKDKKRSPTGFWQEIEAGIPGLRPNVPESRQ